MLRETRVVLLSLLVGSAFAAGLVIAAANTAGGWSEWPLGGAPAPSCSVHGNQPLGAAWLAVGTASEASKGALYWYNFTIESAGSGVTWNLAKLSVALSTGPLPSSVQMGIESYSVVASNGSVLLWSTGPAESSWTPEHGAATALISSTQSISMLTTSDLGGTGAILVVDAGQASPCNPLGDLTHANIP